MIYEFYYPKVNVRQKKILIPHEVYESYKEMPHNTLEEQSAAKGWLKGHTKGMEWFTDRSPLFKSISTGVLECNGRYKVEVNRCDNY